MSSSILILLSVFVLILSVVVHELAHGYAALYFGDDTAKRMGRLSFNPLVHLDPLGSVLLPICLYVSGVGILFAWAKPVPISVGLFRCQRWGVFFVSLAGPLSNFLLIVLFFFLSFWVTSAWLLYVCLYGIQLNFILGVFNLLPIPPLDGSKLILAFLSVRFQYFFYKYEMMGMGLLFILIYFGALDWLFRLSVLFYRLLPYSYV